MIDERARTNSPEANGDDLSAKLRGSVLVIVIITLMFAAFALVVFMDKASNDLLVEHRDSQARRLRMEAYSALEVTLAVLVDFQQVNGGLHSPAEGWNDPLAFAGYTPTEDRTVDISFEDESGKISLPRVNTTVLINLFKNWQISQNDSEALADALMGWMKKDHVYTTGLYPDYEQSTPAYLPPARSLRSFQELVAIDKVRELFFDNGRPNDQWRRFVDSVSLLDFPRANLNGARPDTLAAVGQFDETSQQNVMEFLQGTGAYQNQGPGFFKNPAEAQRILGGAGDVSGFGSNISALRIIVTVHDGRAQFRLAAVITPQGQGGATTIQTTATSQRAPASATNARNPPMQQTPPNPAASGNRPGGGANPNANANARNLRYPFTLLEIRENDEIAPAPPPPPSTDQLI